MSQRSFPSTCGLLLLSTLLATASGADRKILLRPSFDPTAESVDVFAGIERGDLRVEMRPRDETGGALFIENLSDQPLTVELPEALVGLQVLPQSFFPGPNGSDTFGNSSGNQNQGQGQSQPVGGGAGGSSQSNSSLSNVRVNVNAPGPGFFSVPPERIARIEYQSVCLVHGARTPRLGQVYQLVPCTDYSSDPRLAQLLKRVGAGGGEQRALQAAAWHLANDMSWDELRHKEIPHLNAPSTHYFTAADLDAARELVAQVTESAETLDAPPAAIDDTLPSKPLLSQGR